MQGFFGVPGSGGSGYFVKLIDTCGWIEWLTNGVLNEAYQPFFEQPDKIIVPTAVQFELYKWILRNSDIQRALEVVGLTEQCQVIPLSTAIALSAADYSVKHQLSFADAIIYATARFHHAELVTSDAHFKALPSVTLFKKN